ncbi:hypothetical protein VVD49_00775 [Uliginosibacterium sp. H3]|uniref:Uncharacterized protein n=1 Tax=Uliginosibacterium silvisoli TaxID=3114758 RepID=A0ABU6JZ34_9RHOO|nr:hypothetical protein [Uliginosibacterium sp. H3]
MKNRRCNVTHALAAKPMLIGIEEARKQVAGEMAWGEHSDATGTVKRHVVRFDKQKAAL